jgi:quercetin dioxygenase-like cupin family protein
MDQREPGALSANYKPLTEPFDEEAVRSVFVREGLSPSHWSNPPGDTYAAHSHRHHKVLYCVSGSITFRLPGTGESFELRPGDRLDIEPGTEHSAVVGPQGVACVEAARP